jgi:pyridoxal phosphate enzyme (YggS family)
MEDFSYIRRNLDAISAELAAHAAKAGYPAPLLVAVTKSASDDEVLALAACGVSAMAENRVQNFSARCALLSSHGFSPALHLIGTLQTNKVKYLVSDVSLIQSVDSLRLAAEIDKQAAKASRTIDVLCEINSGREAQKSGVLPEDALAVCRTLAGGDYPHLRLRGLMTMAPAVEEEAYRPYFRETKALFDRCAAEGLFGTNPILSMGMSDSYRVAAEEGATMVRVGRGLFKKDF